jgi:flap endonuclease-1
MGIEYFSNFIKEHAPNCYFEIPLESFRGRRFAIDTNNLTYAMMCVAIKEVLEQTSLTIGPPDRAEIHRLAIDKIIGRLSIYLQYGITPVCVFDGKPHELKNNAKKKNNREQIKLKLKEAEIKLYSVDTLFRTQILVNEYRKYYKQNTEVSFDFMNQLRDILITVGFPVLSATDFGFDTRDAEGICATLCLQGNDYCVGTVSTDSDYHAYGGNIQITDVYPKYITTNGLRITSYYARVRSLESILNQSGLRFDQFRDLCILQGTDYNRNIPGVGVKTSWDYITRYGSINAMAKNNINVSILNYDNVLKIFVSTIVPINIPAPDFDIYRFRQHGRNTFDIYGLRDHASSIADSLDHFSVPNTVLGSLQSQVLPTGTSLLTEPNTNNEPVLTVINL